MRAIRLSLFPPHHAVWTLAGALAVEKRQQLDVLVGGDLNTNYSWYMCASAHTRALRQRPCINQCRCESQKGGLVCKHKHQGKMLCTPKLKMWMHMSTHISTETHVCTHTHSHTHLAYGELT